MSRALNFLFLVIIALFALGQLQRLEIAPGLAVYGHDFLIIIWLILFAWFNREELKNIVSSIFSWVFKSLLLLAFLVWIFLGMLLGLSSAQSLTYLPFLYLGRALVYLLFTFLSARAVGKDQAQGYWIIAGLLVLMLGFLQYLFLPDVRFLYLLGWDDHYFRMVGSMFDPAFTGMILVFCFAYIRMHYPRLDKLHAFTLLAIVVGVLLTYSRSSYLALVPVLMAAMTTKKSLAKITKFIIPSVMIIVIIYALAPKPGGTGVNLLRTDTIRARINNISANTNNLSPKTLLIGDGLFTRVQNFDQSSVGISHAAVPDNLFLMMLRATGIPGLTLFIILLSKLGLYFYHQDKVLFSAFVGLIINSQFNNTMLQPFVMLYFLGGVMSTKTLKSP